MRIYAAVISLLVLSAATSSTSFAATIKKINSCVAEMSQPTPLEQFESTPANWKEGDVLHMNSQPVKLIVKDLRNSTGLRLIEGQIREVSYVDHRSITVGEYLSGLSGEEYGFTLHQHVPRGFQVSNESVSVQPEYRIVILKNDGHSVTVRSTNVLGAKFYSSPS